MILKRRLLVIVTAVIILIVFIEMVADFLQTPNIIIPKKEYPFLLKTTWNQSGEYARYVENDDDVGCWATAIAQIAHYHRINPHRSIEYQTSKGQQVTVDLDDYPFRHEHFVSSFNDQTSAQSKKQVATNLYYIAALIYTDFGGSGYLEHETMVSRLEKHLGCSVGFYEYSKKKLSGCEGNDS